MLSQRPSRIDARGTPDADLHGRRTICCTSAQPGVFTTVTQTSTASTIVLTRLISTDRPDLFLAEDASVQLDLAQRRTVEIGLQCRCSWTHEPTLGASVRARTVT